MWFRTYGHTDFKFYDQIFYLDYKHKGSRRRAKPGVPKNIDELLTPRALASWFMDDGSYRTKKAKRYYVLNTQSFHPNPVRVSFSAYPLEDQNKPVQALSHNF